MRRGLLLAILFAVSLSAQAQNARGDFSLTTATGQAISGAQVYVLQQPANTTTFTPTVTIFGSSTGAGSAACGNSGGQIPNPLTTDQFGHACGYFPAGTYTVCYVSNRTGTQCYLDQPYNGSSGGGSIVALWVDPRSFGARCDGVTDDAGAIQAAVNSVAGTATPVGIPGTCAIKSQIVLPTGASGSCQWHLVGASQGASILAVTGFPTSDTPMLLRPSSASVCGEAASIENLTINANQIASQALTVQEQRQFNITNLTVQDATGGSVGAEVILGISSGSAHLVGLHVVGMLIDNSNTVFGAGAAARPNYGMVMYTNVSDSDLYNVTVDHIKIAGITNHGDNNTFTVFHPWGFGPGGSPANTWPQFGLQDAAFNTDVVAPEFDTVQFAGIDAIHGFIKVTGGKFVCNDGGDGSSCSPFVVQAESGASNIYLYGTMYQAGALSAPQSPINWLGTQDTATSTYVTQWGKSQVAGRSGLHLGTASNPTTLDALVDTGTAKFLAGIFSNPVSVATSGANVLPADTVNTASVWNGSTAISASWNWKRFTSGSGIPSFDQYVITPPCGITGYPGTGPCQFGVSNITVPTSANFNSPQIFMQGACQSCIGNSSKWIWAQTYGTGANPTDTLNLFNDGGSSGARTISAIFDWTMHALTVPTVNVKDNNSAFSGTFQTITLGANRAYTLPDTSGTVSLTSVSGSASAAHAACVKSIGPPAVLGTCSTQPDAGGACTCN